MKNPTTDEEAFERILEDVSKSDIARHLGLARQMTSRWESVPARYAGEIAEWLEIPIENVIPDLERSVSALLGESAAPILPDLIRIFDFQLKASQWQRKRKPRKRK